METLSESTKFFLDNIEARKRVQVGDADALRISAIPEAPEYSVSFKPSIENRAPSQAIPSPNQVAQAPISRDDYLKKYESLLTPNNLPEKTIATSADDYLKKYEHLLKKEEPMTADAYLKKYSSLLSEPYVEPILQPEQTNVNKKSSENQGFFSGLGSSIVQGVKDTGGLIYAAGATYGSANNAVVDSSKAASLREQNSEALAMKEFKEDIQKRKQLDDSILGGISNVSGAIYDNPEGALQLTVSQLPNMAAAMVPAIALGKLGALGGAALGGPLAPITATIGGIGGFLAGLFVGNTTLEVGGYAQSAASDGRFTDTERDASIVQGAKKGAVITAVDAATLGLSKYILGTASRAIETATVQSLKAGGIDTVQAVSAIKDAQRVALNATASQGRDLSVAAIEKATYETMVKQGLTNPVLVTSVRAAQEAAKESVNTIAKRIGRGGAAIGLETLGEGLGEYLGELAATGKASPTDAILEAFSSLGMSAAELLTPTPLDPSKGQLTSLVDRNATTTALQNQESLSNANDPLRTQVDDLRSFQAKINIEEGYKKNPENVVNVLSAVAFSLSNSQEDKITLQNIDRTAARLGFTDKLNLALGNGQVLTQAQEAGNQLLSNNPAMRSDVIASINDYGNLVPAQGKPKYDYRALIVDSTSESDPDSFNLSTQEDTLYESEGSVTPPVTPPPPPTPPTPPPPPPPPPPVAFNFQDYVAETVNERRRNNGQSPIAATSLVDTTNKLPSGLKTIANLFSIDLYGFDTSDKNENQKIALKGFSDTASNKIFLNTESLKNINGLFLLGHEVFHQFENINPVFAKELSSSIAGFLKNNYSQYAEGLTKNGYNLDQIDSEISGDVLGVVFNDAAYWRGLRTYNPSLFEKVKTILDDFVAKVRNFITVDGGEKAANKKYGRAAKLKAYLSDYETVRDLMAQASVDFIKQTRPSTNQESGPAKFMSDSNDASDSSISPEDLKTIDTVKNSIKLGSISAAAKLFGAAKIFEKTGINFNSLLTAKENKVNNEEQINPNLVVLPITGPHTEKDQVKSDQASKFIGRGSPASSTSKYAAAWGSRANTGSYTVNDVVFISAEGARKGRLDPDKAEIVKAITAGATILTDSVDSGRLRNHNIGERQVAEFLTKSGYIESKPGTWTQPSQPLIEVNDATPKRKLTSALAAVKAEDNERRRNIEADDTDGLTYTFSERRKNIETDDTNKLTIDSVLKRKQNIEKLQKQYDNNQIGFDNYKKQNEKVNPKFEQDFLNRQAEIQRQIDSIKQVDQPKPIKPPKEKIETVKIKSLRKTFDDIIVRFTNKNFHNESILELERSIEEIDQKLIDLNTLVVTNEQDGKKIITEFKLKLEDIGGEGYGDSNAYSRQVKFNAKNEDIGGYVYDQPTTKQELLAQRSQLTESLTQAREKSIAGQDFLYRVSAARMADIFGVQLRSAIAGGANKEEASATYNEYMNAINIVANVNASVKTDDNIEFSAAMEKTINELRKGKEVVKEAETPNDQIVINRLIADVKSQKITAQEAIDLVNKLANGDLPKANSAISTILTSLVNDYKISDSNKEKLFSKIDNFAIASARNNMLRLNTFFDILAMNQTDVTDQARLHSQIAIRYSLADYLSENNNSYTAQEYWMRSMENILDQDPTKISSFTKSEQDEFKDWKKATDGLANRRNVKNNNTEFASSIEEAFPNLLFTNYPLSSMRDVSLLDESDRLILTRHMTADSLPDRFFSDIAFAINTRPDLENEILKQHLSKSEKLEYEAWITNKEKQIDLEVTITSRIPFLKELLGMSFLTEDEIFGSGNTAVAQDQTLERGILGELTRASIKNLPEIIENARQLNLISMEKIRTDGSLLKNKNIVITEDGVLRRRTQEEIDNALDQIINTESGLTGNFDRIYDDSSVNSNEENETEFSIDDNNTLDDSGLLENPDSINNSDDDIRTRQSNANGPPVNIFEGKLINKIVQAYVEKVTSRWKNKPHIIVLSNHLQLPAELRDKVVQKLKEGTGAKGLYDAQTGTAYLFSNYITSEADAQFTLFHEVYGHLGMRAFMGSNFDKFLSDMYQSNSEVRQAVDRKMADGGIARLEATDEVIAEMSEQDVQPSLSVKYTGMLIAGLRKIGLNFVANFIGNMTSAELFYSLAMAKSTAQNGGYYSPLKNAPSDIRFALEGEKKLPYEMVSLKGLKTVAYARYNPLQNEWYLFTATGEDIRQGSTVETFESYEDLVVKMSKLGKLESRLRSGMYRDNKISVDFPKFDQSREMTGAKKLFQSFIRNVQNQYQPLFKIVEQMDKEGRVTFKNKDGSLNTSLDLRVEARLFERKTAVKVEDGNKKYTVPIYQLVNQAKKDGGKFDFEATNTEEMLNKYLLATHAEERNKTVSAIPGNEKFEDGSGMSTKTANDIKQFVKSQPYAKRFFDIAQLLNNMSIDKVNNDVLTGLISEKEGDKRKKAYANYRNLSGPGKNLDLDHSNDPVLNIGRKFNAGRGKDKRALGRGDEAQDILAMTLLGYQASLIKGQKNLFSQKVLNFFETNYDHNFISINEQSVTKKIGEDGFIQLADNEHYYNQPDVMVVRMKGRPITIRFKDSGFNSVKEAIHGSVIPEEMKSRVMFMLGQWTRLTGQVITTYNPYWIPVNFVRDVQTLFFNAVVNKKITLAMAAKMVAKVIPYGMTAFRAAVMDLQPSSDKGKLAQKAFISLMNVGPFKESAKNRLDIYNEARSNGALTSFINRKDLESGLIELNEAMNGKSIPSHIHGVLKFMQLLTIPLEMAPRLAAYEVMKNSGKTARESADYAGRVTVDFNMRGSNEFLRNAYIFANPAIQGTANIIELAKNNPKRFTALAGSMASLGFFVGMITRGLEGDDDDDKKKKPVNSLDQISVSKRATTLIFAPDKPWGAIPLAYGWNVFYAAGLFMADSVFGKTPVHVSALRTVKTAIEAFSPVGGQTFDIEKLPSDPLRQSLGLVLPTMLMPLYQWGINSNRFGGPIYRDSEVLSKSGDSATTMAFNSVNPMAKDFAVWLQTTTGGDRFNTKGIDINPAMMDHFIHAYAPGVASMAYDMSGQAIKKSRGFDIGREKSPFVDRFSGLVPESAEASQFRRVSEEVNAAYKEFKRRPPSDPRSKEILQEHPNLAAAQSAIDISNKLIRDLRNSSNVLEEDAYQFRRAGKVALADQKEKDYAAFVNKQKAAEKIIYDRAITAFIKAGFEPLIVSNN